MGQNSKIEWTNDTWNPWQGCRKISSGCKFCYMHRDKKRYGNDPTVIVKSKPATFNSPLTKLKGPLVFTCSWSDFFISQADLWRDEAWDIIRQTPHLTYQILTKRPENILDRLPSDWGDGWDNVWLGVSVENQDYTWRMDILRGVPCKLRFVSAEPLLGELSLNLDNFNWVITGGESGEGENWRISEFGWFAGIKDQCIEANVLFFHKQNGGNIYRNKVNGIVGGNLLDGKIYNEIPRIVRVD